MRRGIRYKHAACAQFPPGLSLRDPFDELDDQLIRSQCNHLPVIAWPEYLSGYADRVPPRHREVIRTIEFKGVLSHLARLKFARGLTPLHRRLDSVLNIRSRR